MKRRAEEIKNIVNTEMERIKDPVIYSALKSLLVFPIAHLRAWEWDSLQKEYQCWTVMEDKDSATGIVYSDFGFGPKKPWGLVFLSELNFGMNTGWFSNLEDTFCDSFTASSLPVWNVVKNNSDNTIETIAVSLSLDDAFEKRDEENALLAEPIYQIIIRQC
jgi:hypothetical protein